MSGHLITIILSILLNVPAISCRPSNNQDSEDVFESYSRSLNYLVSRFVADQSQANCGLIPKRNLPTPYVAGGYSASKGDFPSYVRMNYFGGLLCGGTLISERYVLTSAHCLKDIFIAGLTISPTNTLLNEPEEKSYRAIGFCRANEYLDDFDGFDIGIVKLKEPVKIDRYVQPACLPDSPINSDLQAYAVGLGKTRTNSTHYAKHLQVLPVKHQDCEESDLDKTKLCFVANTASHIGDTCKGDSGGPIFQMIDGKLTLIATTSYGAEACEKGNPGRSVNAYIYNLRDEIEKLKNCIESKIWLRRRAARQVQFSTD